ncbi:MAG: class I SAM-dependent methyltransferase [Chitinophagaceae bacterium]|nr:MAG: class I SAM-dependent methyltransferase [Chitinophagaceae bacterium]
MSTQTTNINDIFFEGVYKEVWRKLIPPGLSEVECEFIQDVAQLKKGDAVLDLMCGYGRHALELARHGYRVTAVDNSEDYITEIKVIAKEQSLPVEAISNSTLTVQLSQSYAAAICMGNSFAFFNREDAVTLLKNIASHLAYDGILIINSWMIAEIAIKHFREKEWYNVDNYKYILDYQFHFHPSRIESEHTIISDRGEMEVIKGVDYIFTLTELEAMFNEAGLQTKALYSTPKKRPFKMGDNKVYIVAQKSQPI